MAQKRGKRYRALREKYDLSALYDLGKALEIVKDAATAKFDETVDVTFVLGIDPRKGDQQVRGTLTLPHGSGKTPVVVAITDGEGADAAKEAGADFVGADDIIAQIANDQIDFDVIVATPDMMRSVARLGRKLGPRMPNAKSGTVGTDIGDIVAQRKKGQIEYRNESKAPIIHSLIGKVSFEASALQQNCEALIDALKRAKPASAKGTYFKSITVSSTMGPGVKVDPALFI